MKGVPSFLPTVRGVVRRSTAQMKHIQALTVQARKFLIRLNPGTIQTLHSATFPQCRYEVWNRVMVPSSLRFGTGFECLKRQLDYVFDAQNYVKGLDLVQRRQLLNQLPQTTRVTGAVPFSRIPDRLISDHGLLCLREVLLHATTERGVGG